MATLPAQNDERKPSDSAGNRSAGADSVAARPGVWIHALFAGLLTSASVSVLGAVLSVAGCAGWFRRGPPLRAERCPCPCSSRRIRHRHRAPRGRPASRRARSGARMASCSRRTRYPRA